MRGSAHNGTHWGRWLAPVFLATLGALTFALPAQAQVTPHIEISPSSATIDVGEEAFFDIFLNDAADASVVAWELHLQVTNAEVIDFVSQPGNVGQLTGEPVSEVGAVGPLVRLNETGDPVTCNDTIDNDGDSEIDELDECLEQYFSAQNQLDASGKLDYTVTILRYDPADPGQRVAPFEGDAHLRLGQIKVRGAAGGTAEIQVAGASAGSVLSASADPVKVVELTAPGGDLALVPVLDQSGQTLATVEVSSPDTSEFAGKVLAQLPLSPDSSNSAWFIFDVEVSFWAPGAVPPFQGGSATPVYMTTATTNGDGEFVVSVPSATLAHGPYDVRVKERKTLSNLVASVEVSDTPSSPPMDFGRLRDGDVNGDNLVDGADFSTFRLSFGKLDTDPSYNANANFNRDNVVDGQDFSRFRANFGVLGD